MLVPRNMSQSSENSDQPRDILDGLNSDLSSTTSSPNISPAHAAQQRGITLGMDDLDLLPTKEECTKAVDDVMSPHGESCLYSPQSD